MGDFMYGKQIIRYAISIFILTFATILFAEEKGKQQGMPPAKVVVSEVRAGMIAPQAEFIGTVYYQVKSEVASEVDGKVDIVNFDEGDRVKDGDVLVQLNTDLLEKTIQATRANYEQVLSDLDKARRDLERAENLFKNQLVTEQTYDERRFAVSGLEKKAIALQSDVERLEVKLKKTAIKAPFAGVVVKKNVDRGEWLSSDATAMTIGMDDFMVPVVNVPERIVNFIKVNQYVDVTVGDNVIKGKVVAIVPKADTLTRTVPVKIGIPNIFSLIEGLEARVSLPTGKKERTLTVPRDAVITMFGNTVVFSVNDSNAKMIPVKVTGYKGMIAGIAAEGLREGMKVVVKGNERLMDGQAVIIQE
jgi:RND family efflux transporter MFP subunit